MREVERDGQLPLPGDQDVRQVASRASLILAHDLEVLVTYQRGEGADQEERRQEGEVEREDPERAARVEVAQVAGRPLGVEQDARDEEAGEGEEEIDPHPAGAHPLDHQRRDGILRRRDCRRVARDDEEDGETPQGVEPGDVHRERPGVPDGPFSRPTRGALPAPPRPTGTARRGATMTSDCGVTRGTMRYDKGERLAPDRAGT